QAEDGIRDRNVTGVQTCALPIYVLNYGGLDSKHTGLSYNAAKWLADQGVVNIGVDSPAIDLTPDDLDYSGHLVCGEYDITNTERSEERRVGKESSDTRRL